MPWSVHVGFVVDEVALGQVFHQVLWFFYHYEAIGSPFSYIIWRMNSRHVGGCSSET
jgi:hypothetical protein